MPTNRYVTYANERLTEIDHLIKARKAALAGNTSESYTHLVNCALHDDAWHLTLAICHKNEEMLPEALDALSHVRTKNKLYHELYTDIKSAQQASDEKSNEILNNMTDTDFQHLATARNFFLNHEYDLARRYYALVEDVFKGLAALKDEISCYRQLRREVPHALLVSLQAFTNGTPEEESKDTTQSHQARI